MPIDGKVIDATDRIVDTYKKHKLDAVVCIGGNGTDLVAAINALPAKIASSVASLIPKPVKSAVQAVGSGIATAYDYTIGAAGRGIGSAAGALIYGS